MRQSYTDFELIMVDNASSDDSVLFTKEHYPTIKIVQSEKNLGFAGGNNLGIAVAS
jgi:GT2 family glycosyltransferase